MEQVQRKQIKAKVGKLRLPEGKHTMSIRDFKDIQQELSKFGNQCQTTEVLLTGKVFDKEMEVWQKLWLHSDPGSLFQQLIWATGIEPDEEGDIDLTDALDKTIQVIVERQGQFVNVTKFLPTNRQSSSSKLFNM
ncbi:hypothetical protein JTI58_12145 [Lysinibacillus fusiformis]|uniref:hypothetical protein n=1 Tax=Lysinibacillus fusiformis TaxID=28031 RepID=UPI00196881B9|nr:hypothetical protein [Lysinibacillus fusiformis]QSB12308.1 hypothetical protein JTI58_12145 [Lysinibacillus fusiformis]